MAYTTSNISTTANRKSGNGNINYITDVSVKLGRIPTGGTSKQITVKGSSDANFSIEVYRSSDNAYYDFNTKAFSTTITVNSRLKNAKVGAYNIVFPANASGDTYTVLIWAEKHFNTELAFGRNKYRHAITINQLAGDATLTLATEARIGKTAVTTLGTSARPSGQSYSSPQSITFVEKQITFTSHADDYGVMIFSPTIREDLARGTWDSSALYWETGNYTANGSGSSATTLILTSVDDLYIGMQVSHVDGTFQDALRKITAINTSTLTVTLDGAESWDTGEPIKFRAYGSDLIRSAISIGVTTLDAAVRLAPISTTLRTAITSGGQDNADVVGTTGFGQAANTHGTKTTVKSVLIDNSEGATGMFINSVSGSTTAGVINVENGQFTDGTVGTIIHAVGCSNLVYLTGAILIDKYPIANQTISVDLSKFLRAGSAS